LPRFNNEKTKAKKRSQNHQQSRAPRSPTPQCHTGNNSKPEKVTENLQSTKNSIKQCQLPLTTVMTVDEKKETVPSS